MPPSTESDVELHFPNPPITEAILELRVRNPGGSELESLDPFIEAIAVDYPEKRLRTSVKAHVHVDAEEGVVKTEGTSDTIGFLLRSTDGLYVAQPRLDLFAFSRLKPYEKWSVFRDEAKRLWDIYAETIRPAEVTRIGLRYINRVEIPVPKGGLEYADYFLTAPQIAEGVSQELPNFFMRLVVPDDKGRGTAIITETVDTKPPWPEVVPLIFDIDAFLDVKEEPNSPEVWIALEQLRMLKNEIFDLSFTDKAKELFL